MPPIVKDFVKPAGAPIVSKFLSSLNRSDVIADSFKSLNISLFVIYPIFLFKGVNTELISLKVFLGGELLNVLVAGYDFID